MSRYLTTPERDMLAAGAGYLTRATLWVKDFDGTWHDLGEIAAGSRTLRMFSTATLSDDIDRNTLSMTATVKREAGPYSLSPFRTDSPLNTDASSLYSPLIDLHREWRIDAVFADRSAPPTLPTDYREMASGIIDRIDIQGDPATITIQGRGREAILIDWKIVGPKTYASGPIEDVLQDILDGEFGVGAIPLTLDPSAPSYYVNGWTQTESIGCFDLLTQVAALPGANLRYRYDASDVLSLTLFTPPRNATSSDVDWEIGGDEYESLSAGLGLESVRNFVVVKYMSTAGVVLTATSPALPSSASIDRYGLRVLEIDLSADTKVNDITGAQPLADAVVADWELPYIEQQLTGHGLWFGSLYDYVRTLANGYHYDQDQYGAVVGYTQTFANGMLASSFQLRGKPAGRYTTWLNYGGAAAVIAPPTILNLTAAHRYNDVTVMNEIFVIATANTSTDSVGIELSTDPGFATTYATATASRLSNNDVYYSFPVADADVDAVFYVRMTPYTGPIDTTDPVNPVPSGTPGAPVSANTPAPPTLVDSPTITVDRSVAGEVSFELAGGVGGVGGTGSYTIFDPDAPFASPSIYDDEFNAATIDPKWTQVNTGLAGVTVDTTTVDSMLRIVKTTNSAPQVALLQALPVGDFTAFMKVDHTDTVGNFWGAGFVLADGTTAGAGNQYQAVNGHTGGGAGDRAISVFRQTNFSTFSSTVFSGPQAVHHIYLRLSRSGGTSWTLDASTTGITWISAITWTQAFTPTHFGINYQHQRASTLDEMFVEFFRVVVGTPFARLGARRIIVTG